MATERKRLNTQIDDVIAEKLVAWQEAYDKNESEVVRVALILGLQHLKRDPTPLGLPKLDPTSISPPDLDARVKAAKALLASETEEEEDSKARAREEEIRSEIEDAEIKRKTGLRPPSSPKGGKKS